MPRYHGKDLIVRWIDGAGTVTISGDRRTLDVSEEIEEKDMTAGTATLYRLRPGQSGTLLFGPLGTAAGLPKGGFSCSVKSQPMAIPYDDNQDISE